MPEDEDKTPEEETKPEDDDALDDLPPRVEGEDEEEGGDEKDPLELPDRQPTPMRQHILDKKREKQQESERAFADYRRRVESLIRPVAEVEGELSGDAVQRTSVGGGFGDSGASAIEAAAQALREAAEAIKDAASRLGGQQDDELAFPEHHTFHGPGDSREMPPPSASGEEDEGWNSLQGSLIEMTEGSRAIRERLLDFLGTVTNDQEDMMRRMEEMIDGYERKAR